MAKIVALQPKKQIPLLFFRDIRKDDRIFQAARLLVYVDRHLGGSLDVFKLVQPREGKPALMIFDYFKLERIQVYAARLAEAGVFEKMGIGKYRIALDSEFWAKYENAEVFCTADTLPREHLRTEGRWKRFQNDFFQVYKDLELK